MARARTETVVGLTARDARSAAWVAGALYLVTFIAGIPPALFLYSDLMADGADALTASTNSGIRWGAFLDVINALACVGTAVVLFPVLRRCRVRFGEAAALGFVTTRVIEATVILVGVLSLLSLVVVRQDLDASSAALGQTLLAVHDWTLILGPGLIPALNAALFASVLYRADLVPRIIPTLGLIGAPLLATAASLSILGVNEPGTVLSDVAVAPIFFWELSVGIYLLVKGFKPTAVAAFAVDR